MRLKVSLVTHSKLCSYEYFWPLFIYESSSFIPCHAWFVFLGLLSFLFFWMVRLLADSEGQLNATLCENSRGPILGIYEAEYYDLVTTSFGSFVTGRNHPRQASKHQAEHHLSGQVQKVRPGFPSARRISIASTVPPWEEGLNG